jgi:chondroitin AC lyase
MPLDDELLHVKGPTSFVGGVSDGTYGLAAMDFRRETLGVRKLWFCFDDGVACMGAAIGCESNNPVLTSVNQCLLKGEVEVAGTNCGSRVSGTGEHVLKRPRWVYHDGVGYMFPAPARVVVRYGPQLGSWADIGAGPSTPVKLDVFNLWIDHGVQPKDGSYLYMVLPGTTPEQLARRGASRMVEQVSNTAALQALRHRGLGLCAAAFYQAGTLAAGAGWNISVDQPCLLLAQERNGGLQISVANPENQALTVNLELDRGLSGPGATALAANRTRITVELPGGVEAGRSVVRVFTPRLDGVPQPSRRDRAG